MANDIPVENYPRVVDDETFTLQIELLKFLVTENDVSELWIDFFPDLGNISS